MPSATIGDLIRANREARRWSLQDLATRSGLSRKLISHYECQQITNVPSKSIVALARAFGVEAGALYPKQPAALVEVEGA
jgi:transcriptional regulator with XRE-family HTH domain